MKVAIFVFTILLVGVFAPPVRAQKAASPRFKAVAFDYFMIFNANSVIPAVEEAFPGQGVEFTKRWRAKQFDYCFLQSITKRHEDSSKSPKSRLPTSLMK